MNFYNVMKNEYDLPNIEILNSNVWKTLLKIARKNKTKLFYTFSLVAVENIMFLVYPIFAGISINAILEGVSTYLFYCGFGSLGSRGI